MILGDISKKTNNTEGLATQTTNWGGQGTSFSVSMQKNAQGQNFLVTVGQYQYDAITDLLGLCVVSLSPSRFSDAGANIIDIKERSNKITSIAWSNDTLTVDFSTSSYYVISIVHI